MCTQRRLRSARTSAQSDQSLRCPHEEALGLWLHVHVSNECTANAQADQTGRMPRLIFAGRKGHFVDFVMRRLIYRAQQNLQNNVLCAQWRLGSDRTSAQSDQSSPGAQWIAKDSTCLKQAGKTLFRLPGCTCTSWSETHFVGYVMPSIYSC